MLARNLEGSRIDTDQRWQARQCRPARPWRRERTSVSSLSYSLISFEGGTPVVPRMWGSSPRLRLVGFAPAGANLRQTSGLNATPERRLSLSCRRPALELLLLRPRPGMEEPRAWQHPSEGWNVVATGWLDSRKKSRSQERAVVARAGSDACLASWISNAKIARATRGGSARLCPCCARPKRAGLSTDRG